MSIKKIEMYTVICDVCGKDSADRSEFAGWNDKSYAEDIADCASFAKEGDNHYCSDCFEYDDDDNLIIKNQTK